MAESATTTALAVYLLTHKKPLKRLGRAQASLTPKQGVKEKLVDAKLYPNSFSP